MTVEELHKDFLKRELFWDARFKKLEDTLHVKHSLLVEKTNQLERIVFTKKIG